MKNRSLRTFLFAAGFAIAACGGDDNGNGDGGTSGGGGNSPGTGGDGMGPGSGGSGTGGAAPGSGGAPAIDTCIFPAALELENANVPEGYCAFTWASNLNHPRGIVVDDSGNVLVVDDGRIVLLYDDDENGVSDDGERVEIRVQSGLNHGIAINNGYLYASTPTTVYRWPYAADRATLGDPQEVVTGIPGGGHSTRTLLFDAEGRLYVSVGSGGNVDGDSSRSRIVRYAPADLGSTSTFAEGEVFADGLRNEVGLAMDGQGRIWGVENGRDDLERGDLGGDIHEDNPGEELNLFREEDAGRFYGYPYCWSEGSLAAGDGPGTQWADPDNTAQTDEWCKNTDNVIPPVMVMQAHSAPLDILFYSGSAFPGDMAGDALVTFHGSWNRSTETGYKVVSIPFGTDGMPAGDPIPFLESANVGDTDPDWPHRPVGLAVLQDGPLLVSSDASNVVIAVGYSGN